MVLYVDDILLASNNIDLFHDTKKFLSKKFEMKGLGVAYFVLELYRYGIREIWHERL